MLSLGHQGMFGGLDKLAHGIFRAMLAGVGIGCSLSHSRLGWRFFDG